MEVSGAAITVPTNFIMHDHDLEQFVRCPCCFHRKQSQSHEHQGNWQRQVQQSIDYVIQDYYKLSLEARSEEAIRKSLDRNWVDIADSMGSVMQAADVKRQIASSLSSYLLEDESETIPIILLEQLSVAINKMNMNLSMMLQIAQWTESSYVIKKIFIEDEPNVIRAYMNMCLVFAYQAFGKLPERIEVYSLLSGAGYGLLPDQDDVEKAQDFLRLAHGMMTEEPKDKQAKIYH
ncbi:hypothetical protein NV379_11250 [Paenibacillus sp. N1-5-1-14]|uniref:hypothetical protein n=1 Tax=Paenibacillus radicibacter TaxID=2972488 RepID=UPI0021593559|nr:hypothetical protein [Paenibacillus radicibacter]MCR8643237.1 hypothetical protein [Paenibacillus radicibacter]